MRMRVSNTDVNPDPDVTADDSGAPICGVFALSVALI